MSTQATPTPDHDEQDSNQNLSRASFTETDSRKDEMHDTIEDWIQDLIDATEEARANEEFQEWLTVQSKFHDYSYRNTLLIKLQKPDASQVAGYHTWKNDFDRYVQKGESGIWIWAPIITKKCPDCGNATSYHNNIDCDYDDTDPDSWERGLVGFKPTTVFDISQTEGEPLPEPDISAETHGDGAELVDDFLDAGELLDLDVTVVPEDDWEYEGKKGVCKGRSMYDLHPIIEVVDRENKADLVRTLAHEYAHAKLHFGVDDREEKRKREVEAESVAYAVARNFGLDPENSGFYLASWTDDEEDILRERLQRISSTIQTIIEAIETAGNRAK